eukprot:494312_1
MSASLQPTAEGGENQEDSINYVELLRVTLRNKKLIYIADIVLEIEEFTLAQLLKWTRNDLTELLADINNDNDNDYKIKVSHRNKFADAVCYIAQKQKETLEKQIVAPAATSSPQMKLLFLGKEEEEAIEAIQSSQQFMNNNLNHMKKSFNNLDKHNKNVIQKLGKLCDELKQEIDKKQKEMLSKVNMVYQYHLNIFNKHNEESQHSAKVVAKFFNDYENYFTDNKLTKMDRKNKLIAAKESTDIEVNKIKKHEHIPYNIDVDVNKHVVNELFNQFLELSNIDIFALPKASFTLKGAVMKWKPPKLNENSIVLFQQLLDDNKEKSELLINYRILYCNEEHKDDEKKD